MSTAGTITPKLGGSSPRISAVEACAYDDVRTAMRGLRDARAMSPTNPRRPRTIEHYESLVHVALATMTEVILGDET